MADKEEFLNGLFNSFYVYNSDRQKLYSCTFKNKKLHGHSISLGSFESTLQQAEIHKVEDMYFMNNRYQKGWNSPVMTISRDISSEITEGKFCSGLINSLRDRKHLIKVRYRTPILHMDDILETIGDQDTRENNFTANLYRMVLPQKTLPQEEKEISDYLMNKNDFSQINKRRSLDLELVKID